MEKCSTSGYQFLYAHFASNFYILYLLKLPAPPRTSPLVEILSIINFYFYYLECFGEWIKSFAARVQLWSPGLLLERILVADNFATSWKIIKRKRTLCLDSKRGNLNPGTLVLLVPWLQYLWKNSCRLTLPGSRLVLLFQFPDPPTRPWIGVWASELVWAFWTWVCWSCCNL